MKLEGLSLKTFLKRVAIVMQHLKDPQRAVALLDEAREDTRIVDEILREMAAMSRSKDLTVTPGSQLWSAAQHHLIVMLALWSFEREGHVSNRPALRLADASSRYSAN